MPRADDAAPSRASPSEGRPSLRTFLDPRPARVGVSRLPFTGGLHQSPQPDTPQSPSSPAAVESGPQRRAPPSKERSALVSLSDLTPVPAIRLEIDAEDWRSAIQHAGELLTGVGVAGPSYVQAMIDVIEEPGPYVVITPGLAIAPARPGPEAADHFPALPRRSAPRGCRRPEHLGR